MIATCMHCYYEFNIEDVILGELITCPDCIGDLEVIEITKKYVKTQQAEEVAEDFGE